MTTTVVVSETRTLTVLEARQLTEEVKADVASLWAKLLRLYDGKAHIALGYTSWGDYFEAEFGQSDASAYRLLQSARVMEQLPMGSPRPTNERVARELTPLLKQLPANPEVISAAWGAVVEEYGPEPTAKQVRDIVADAWRPRGPRKDKGPTSMLRAGESLLNLLDLLDGLLGAELAHGIDWDNLEHRRAAIHATGTLREAHARLGALIQRLEDRS